MSVSFRTIGFPNIVPIHESHPLGHLVVVVLSVSDSPVVWDNRGECVLPFDLVPVIGIVGDP